MTREIIVNDIIWGKVVINEPVAVEIIKTKAFQRLKGIDQAGYLPLYNNPHNLDRKLLKHTRYQHSIGVYWLLKIKGDSLGARISGLIHDVSHAAFSHAVDYIFTEGCQKYHRFQDDNHLVYLKKTNIPQVLRKHGLNFLKIAREANYPLLENNLPDICADRIDYSLRTALHFREFKRQEIVYLLKHLKTQNKKWYFDNLAVGRKFAKLFKKMNDDYFSNQGVAIMFYSLKEFFRYAIQQKYVTKKDFIFGDDDGVFRKIKRYLKKDKLLAKLYNNLHHSEIYQVSIKKISDNVIYCKSRIIDPPILYAWKISRLSLIDKSWGKILKEDLKPNKFYVK